MLFQDEDKQASEYIADGIQDGCVWPYVSKEFSIRQAPRAHKLIAFGRAASGKIVFVLWSYLLITRKKFVFCFLFLFFPFLYFIILKTLKNFLRHYVKNILTTCSVRCKHIFSFYAHSVRVRVFSLNKPRSCFIVETIDLFVSNIEKKPLYHTGAFSV